MNIDEKKSTRRPKGGARATTPYQIHVSQVFDREKRRHLIDVMEHRLLRMIRNEKDYDARECLVDLLYDYKHGNIAIAMRRGEMLVLPATQEGAK